MKYFKEGATESHYGKKGIILNERIFSIMKDGSKIVFREECDGFFYGVFTQHQSVELLQEAIDWIKNT